MACLNRLQVHRVRGLALQHFAMFDMCSSRYSCTGICIRLPWTGTCMLTCRRGWRRCRGIDDLLEHCCKRIDVLRKRRNGRRVWRHVLRKRRGGKKGLEARPAEVEGGAGIAPGTTAALASAADSPQANLLDTTAAGLEATGAAAFPGKNAQEATAQAGCRQGRIS